LGVVDQYLVKPLADPTGTAPYNIVNTTVFALLALIAAYLIYLGLKRLKVKIDEEFVKSVLPFIFLGAIVRVTVDASVLPRVVNLSGITFYPFVTPSIYILTFLAFAAALTISLARPGKFHPTMRVIGTALALLALLPLIPLFKMWLLLAAIVILALLPLAVVYYAAPRLGWRFGNLEYLLILSQCIDGAATFVGISAGYSEQHVMGNFLIGISPIVFYLVKAVFATAVALVLSGEKDSDEKTYVGILIIIFGLAPGTRDALRILAWT